MVKEYGNSYEIMPKSDPDETEDQVLYGLPALA
jgi:hypothetical protein